jgi:FKBP-type peptidyl-prolyl cis-trans isomerase 2
MKKILLLPVLLALVLLTAGCTQQVPQQQTPQQPQQTPPTVVQNSPLTAQYGDNVTVDYTLRVDGKVLDTSSIDTAKQAGIYDSTRSYQPMTFPLLLGSGLINGFVNGILGMKVGEEKNFTVAPADGYGLVDPTKMTNVARYYNRSVFDEVPMSYVLAQNVTVKQGKVFQTNMGYVGIMNFTNDTVTIEYLFSPGDQFAMNGIPETVVNITNETMVIRSDMEANHTYSFNDPSTGTTTPLRVAAADNSTITIDANSPLAGKELDFDVTLRALSR